MTKVLTDILKEQKNSLLITKEPLNEIQKQISSEKTSIVITEKVGETFHEIFIKKQQPIPDYIFLLAPSDTIDSEGWILLTKYGIEHCTVVLCDLENSVSLHKIKEDIIHKVITSMTSDILFYNYSLYEQQKDTLYQKLNEKIMIIG